MKENSRSARQILPGTNFGLKFRSARRRHRGGGSGDDTRARRVPLADLTNQVLSDGNAREKISVKESTAANESQLINFPRYPIVNDSQLQDHSSSSHTNVSNNNGFQRSQANNSSLNDFPSPEDNNSFPSMSSVSSSHSDTFFPDTSSYKVNNTHLTNQIPSTQPNLPLPNDKINHNSLSSQANPSQLDTSSFSSVISSLLASTTLHLPAHNTIESTADELCSSSGSDSEDDADVPQTPGDRKVSKPPRSSSRRRKLSLSGLLHPDNVLPRKRKDHMPKPSTKNPSEASNTLMFATPTKVIDEMRKRHRVMYGHYESSVKAFHSPPSDVQATPVSEEGCPQPASSLLSSLLSVRTPICTDFGPPVVVEGFQGPSIYRQTQPEHTTTNQVTHIEEPYLQMTNDTSTNASENAPQLSGQCAQGVVFQTSITEEDLHNVGPTNGSGRMAEQGPTNGLVKIDQVNNPSFEFPMYSTNELHVMNPLQVGSSTFEQRPENGALRQLDDLTCSSFPRTAHYGSTDVSDEIFHDDAVPQMKPRVRFMPVINEVHQDNCYVANLIEGGDHMSHCRQEGLLNSERVPEFSTSCQTNNPYPRQYNGCGSRFSHESSEHYIQRGGRCASSSALSLFDSVGNVECRESFNLWENSFSVQNSKSDSTTFSIFGDNRSSAVRRSANEYIPERHKNQETCLKQRFVREGRAYQYSSKDRQFLPSYTPRKSNHQRCSRTMQPFLDLNSNPSSRLDPSNHNPLGLLFPEQHPHQHLCGDVCHCPRMSAVPHSGYHPGVIITECNDFDDCESSEMNQSIISDSYLNSNSFNHLEEENSQDGHYQPGNAEVPSCNYNFMRDCNRVNDTDGFQLGNGCPSYHHQRSGGNECLNRTTGVQTGVTPLTSRRVVVDSGPGYVTRLASCVKTPHMTVNRSDDSYVLGPSVVQVSTLEGEMILPPQPHWGSQLAGLLQGAGWHPSSCAADSDSIRNLYSNTPSV